MLAERRNFLSGPCPFLCALLLVSGFVVFYFMGGDFMRVHVNYAAEDLVSELNNSEKIILFWTTFFDSPGFYFGLGSSPFQRANCSTQRCRTTADKSLLKKSHAVVFHLRDVELHQLPTYRHPHQRWIYFLLESPENTPTDLFSSLPPFNWTMTYRRDSDIHIPYARIEPKSVQDTHIEEIISRKTKKVAWFVSHCTTPSKREGYVEELSRHIEVDVYGSCGPLKCDDHRACHEMLRDNYMFYLSFENSLCRDYVTEKFFHALEYHVVPIVYGGANYSAIAPRGSYIDTKDFASPKDLASYLNYLSQNRTAYRQYFNWRNEYVVRYSQQSWCDLCQLLHNSTLGPKTYDNMQRWWVDQSHCVKPTF